MNLLETIKGVGATVKTGAPTTQDMKMIPITESNVPSMMANYISGKNKAVSSVQEEAISMEDRWEDTVDDLRDLMESSIDHLNYIIADFEEMQDDSDMGVRPWHFSDLKNYLNQVASFHDQLAQAAQVAKRNKEIRADQKKLMKNTSESQVASGPAEVPSLVGQVHEATKETPLGAKEFLVKHKAYNVDFDTLPHSTASAIHDHAKASGYRKSKNAPGSTGRMFHQHLSRLAKKAPDVKEGFEQIDELENIVMQLRGAQDVDGNREIKFRRDKKIIDKPSIDKFLSWFDSINRTHEKHKAQLIASQSSEKFFGLVRGIKEDVDIHEASSEPWKKEGNWSKKMKAQEKTAKKNISGKSGAAKVIINPGINEEEETLAYEIYENMCADRDNYDARYGDRADDVMMAIATKKAINELSKGTLGNYVQKAVGSYGARFGLAAKFDSDSERGPKKDRKTAGEIAKDFYRGADKRKNGIKLAVKKLAKEEIRQNGEEDVQDISELSKKTLINYIGKASRNAAQHSQSAEKKTHEKNRTIDRAAKYGGSPDHKAGLDAIWSRSVRASEKKASKRLNGVGLAAKKLAKEEVRNV